MTDRSGDGPPLAFGARNLEISALRDRLLALLGAVEDPSLKALHAEVGGVSTAELAGVAFVGQYNAGKSSLLRSLTGRADIAVAADVTTRQSRSYEWNGHHLVDTPGVVADVDPEHDRESAAAVRAADAIVFVITPEGFDDATFAYFAWLRTQLHSLTQLLVVVNKALSEDSDRAAVERDLHGDLGEVLDVVPVLWADADSWLRADAFPNPAARRERSGIRELAATLEEVLVERGTRLRLATPVRQMLGAAEAALAHLSDSPELKAQLDDLALATSLVDAQAERMRSAAKGRLDAAAAALHRRLAAGGPESTPEDVAEAVGAVWQSLIADVQSDDDASFKELPAGTQELAGTVVDASTPTRERDLWHALRPGLEALAERLRALFAGARPGEPGHAAVHKIGHLLGHKFKPYGVITSSRRFSQVAGKVGPALAIGEAAWGFVRSWQEQKQAEAAAESARRWPDRARQIVEAKKDDWARTVAAAIQEQALSRHAAIAHHRAEVLSRQADRSKVSDELLAIHRDLAHLLEALAA